MLAGGIAMLAGWKPVLPMPAFRSPSGHGYGAAYGLGLFSGIASARVGADHLLEVTEIGLASEQGRALAAQAGVLFAPGLLVEGRTFGYGRLSERRLRRTLGRLTHEPR